MINHDFSSSIKRIDFEIIHGWFETKSKHLYLLGQIKKVIIFSVFKIIQITTILKLLGYSYFCY